MKKKITLLNMASAWVLWIFLVLVEFVMNLIAKIFYPVVYPFRNWCRIAVYSKEDILPLDEKFGWYPQRNKVSNIEYWIAKICWMFFDDGPKYSDCGSRDFVKRYYNNEIGQNRTILGGWADIGLVSEDGIFDKFKRFRVAYKWSAMRNAAWNFNETMLTIKNTDPDLIEKIIFTDGRPTSQLCRFKKHDGYCDYNRSTFGKKFVYKKNSKGQTIFNLSFAGITKIFKWLYGYEIKIGWNAEGFRYTFTWRHNFYPYKGKHKEDYILYNSRIKKLTKDIYKKIFIFQLNEYEWYAAHDTASAILHAMMETGLSEDEVLNKDVFTRVGKKHMKKFTFTDDTGKLQGSFEDVLLGMIKDNVKFPCIFASTEF